MVTPDRLNCHESCLRKPPAGTAAGELCRSPEIRRRPSILATPFEEMAVVVQARVRRSMTKRQKDALRGPMGAVAKCFGAALFGGFVSLVLLGAAFWFELEFFFERPGMHVFWIIPVVWGVLGIFWFDAMLDAARHLVEGALDTETR